MSAPVKLSNGRDPHTQARILRAVTQRRWDRGHDRRLKPTHREILRVMDDAQVLSYGRPTLSATTLAEQVGCCVRTVRYRLAELEAWGYVDVCEIFGRRGGQRANAYKVRRVKLMSHKQIAERRRRRAERDRTRKAGRGQRRRHEAAHGVCAADAGEVVDNPPAAPPACGGGLQNGAPSTRARVDPPFGEGSGPPFGRADAGPPGRIRRPGGPSRPAGEPIPARDHLRAWLDRQRDSISGPPGVEGGGGE